jgi:hypothetical protein
LILEVIAGGQGRAGLIDNPAKHRQNVFVRHARIAEASVKGQSHARNLEGQGA